MVQTKKVFPSLRVLLSRGSNTGESTHVGQHNIAERYRLLTNKKVEISETADDYCVTIPLLRKK